MREVKEKKRGLKIFYYICGTKRYELPHEC